MKHVVKQRKPSVKPKTKSLPPVKAVTKTKSPAKKNAAKTALNSRINRPVQKSKTTAKSMPRMAKASAKTSLQKNAPMLSAKTLNALKTVSTRKVKLIAKQTETPKAKKSVAKISAKAAKASDKKIKSTAPKTKTTLKTKKVVAAKKNLKLTARQKPKPKTTGAKKADRKIVKTAARTIKTKITKPTIQKAKKPTPLKAKTISAVKKKIVSPSAKTILRAKKTPKIEKTKLTTANRLKPKKNAAPKIKAKIVKQKTQKTIIAAPKKTGKKLISAKLIVEPKKNVAKKNPVKSLKARKVAEPKKVEAKVTRFKPIAPTENIVWKRLKFKPAISSAKTIKAKQKPKKSAVIEPIVVVEEVKPRPVKPKRGKPIGSAVFRGKKERYDFKVFELDEKFEPIPAVYIISKRKTDHRKRAHHALVCIGQTDSVSAEIKKHRKGGCVKKHAANVVSILPEPNEKIRLQIEIDLRAAHAVACKAK